MNDKPYTQTVFEFLKDVPRAEDDRVWTQSNEQHQSKESTDPIPHHNWD